MRNAYRDIYPKWAQVVDLNYSYAPFDKNIYGKAWTFKTAFYFPGFFPSNGIKIRLEREKQIPSKFFYGNRVSLPRGYNNISVKEINFASIDYVFPLLYPDFNISSLLYLKRIRGGLFYDYASGPGNGIYYYTPNGLSAMYNDNTLKSLKSFGGDLLADFHVFRIPYEISAGIQSAWKSIHEAPTIEFLFNIDLYGMSIGRRPH